MTKIKVNRTSDYTIMGNYHFREKDMSLSAKGLLSLMLSLPKDWDYSILGLVKLSSDGKDKIMNTLKELERFGYLIRTRRIDSKGKFNGYNYEIYERPYSENPYSEKPNTVNPPQLNTKEIKEEYNKEKINKKESVECELLQEFGFSTRVCESINTWLSYKKEKKQSYKPVGLKTLLKSIQREVQKNGEESVVRAIDKSITNNYSGLFFATNNNDSNAKPIQSERGYKVL